MSLFRQQMSLKEQVLESFPILLILDDILEQAFIVFRMKARLKSTFSELPITF